MYTIRKEDFTSVEMMDQLVRLQNKVYAGKHVFCPSTFKHWYIDNPNGNVISFNAFYNDVLVAHYALVPIQMKVDGKIVNGLLSMATVTDPEHQGKGLFKRLAKESFDYSKQNGYQFVVGVANANSYPGFIKYFNFVDLGKLEVLIGFKNNIIPKGEKAFSVFWNKEALEWRLSRKRYVRIQNNICGPIGFGPLKRLLGVNTYMGSFSKDLLDTLPIRQKKWNYSLKLYIGLGSNARDNGYLPVPTFIKRSPFHLIFLDMSDGDLPVINKDNVFFQLIDYDVA